MKTKKCSRCGNMESGTHDVSSTWQEKEREEWRNIDSIFPDFPRYADSIADYWLARIEHHQKQAYSRGRADEIARNIKLND